MRNLERQVELAAREVRPDLIHAHSPVLVGLPALRVARRLGLGFVYEIRDLWENASVDRGRFGAESPMYRVARRLESYVLSRADAVVTICDLLKAELQPRAGRPDKVHVVANGVDARCVRAPGRKRSAERALEARRQGSHSLCRHVPALRGPGPAGAGDWPYRSEPAIGASRHCRRIGRLRAWDGTVSPEERELLALVRETGAANHVTFTGRIPHAEVKDMYAIADVVAYPRRLTRTTALDDSAEAARSDGDGEGGRRQRRCADARARQGRSRQALSSRPAT